MKAGKQAAVIERETPRSGRSNTTSDVSTVSFKQNKVRMDIDTYLDTAFLRKNHRRPKTKRS